MGFDGPCRPRSGVLAPWPFTFAALHVLRLVQRPSRARRLSPTRVNLRTDRELRGPHRGGDVVRTCIPIPPRLWTSSPPFPFNCLFGSAATPTALADCLGVGFADLSGFSKDRPSIEIPGRISSSSRSGPLARSSRSAGVGLPWHLRASHSVPTSPFGTASPASSPPSCRNIASGPDRRVRQLSRSASFRPHPVPAVAFVCPPKLSSPIPAA